MKFSGQDKYGPVVVRHLRDHGPKTGRELAEELHLDVGLANKTVHRLADAGFAARTGEFRGVGKFRSNVFRWVPIPDLEVPERILRGMEREVLLKANERAITALRSSYIPGQFDPFRVLRAQVGGVA
jgi:hypothetical protein